LYVDVSIIAGSRSDMELVKRVENTLEELGVTFETRVMSCHRDFKVLDEYLSKASCKVFIAIAGLSAHLPGYVAARTKKPVIGIPVDKALGGLDSLLSIVQMPKGVPVACVGINGAENAAHLAKRILEVRE
jgi:5-(carboxyamino)imidazole ribonucleotide mutase